MPALSVTAIRSQPYGRLAVKGTRMLVERRPGNGLKVFVSNGIRRRFASETMALGVRRDLTVPVEMDPKRPSVVVRRYQPSDRATLFRTDDSRMTMDDVANCLDRLDLLESGIGTCYVGVGTDGAPCYVQWLFAERDNADIEDYFQGLLPTLDSDTAMVEGAYVPPSARGRGVMANASIVVANQAADIPTRYVVGFIDETNIPSLKSSFRSGYVPYMRRTERWRLFRRRVTFLPLPDSAQSVDDR